MTTIRMRSSLTTALLVGAAVTAGAQGRDDFRWEKALPAGNTVAIHNVNGDVKVTPSTNGKVTIVGIKRGSSRYYDRIKGDVHEDSRGIDVCVIYDDSDSYCDNGGYRSRSRGDHDWNNARMDLEVAVPANLEVSVGTVSGDVTISGAHGDLEVSTVSGDVRADQLHVSSLRANTVSGDMELRVAELTGNGDFSFHSVSGDLTLEVPKTFSADLSMSTVSGDIDSGDFQLTLNGRRVGRRSFSARIGSGGRRFDITTVSGDLRLQSR